MQISIQHAHSGPPVGARSKVGFAFSIRSMIFGAMLLASAIPIIGFYKWVEQSALQREIVNVEDNHLIIAGNLALAMNRYAEDVIAVFEASTAVLLADQITPLAETLGRFDLDYVALLSEDDRIEQIMAPGEASVLLPSIGQLAELRASAAEHLGEVIFSGVQDFQGQPHIFVSQTLPDGRLALAPLSLDYLRELQAGISFGERGHSMIVDQNGRVIAHPNAEWEASSKDASGLSVVARMMAGETGVATFFSPPMRADMISGFTFVPRTGWGVMVPQPMSELEQKAGAHGAAALALATTVGAIVILLSLMVSSQISAPVNRVVEAAKAVSAGAMNVRAKGQDGLMVPAEAKLLGNAFNRALDDLQAERTALDNALQAALAASQAKSRFLAVMSHEIRTPMHGLIGAMELLDDGTLHPAQAELLKAGQSAGRNMAKVLNDALALTRLDLGAERLDIDTFKVFELVAETATTLRPMASKKGLNLESRACVHSVRGDEQKIRQILLNLLSNAIKFTDEGLVCVTADVVQEPGERPLLEVKVRDTGIGVPDRLADTIFEEFSQASSDYQRLQEGMGLGLAISARLAKLMGGELSFESTPGQGSVFRLAAPIELSEA